MKRLLWGLLFLSFFGFNLAGQQTGQQSNQQTGQQSNQQNDDQSNEPGIFQLALSSPDYRVTAGDIYTLAYAIGGTSIVYQIPVDNTYRIRVSNLGVINVAGKTFQQLKAEVEAIVSKNYPLSGVQFALVTPATFKVYIKGEVQLAKEEVSWALARLSTVLTDQTLTAFSSIRDISITSTNQRTQIYDLYKAQRLGDLSQDPYLRPGDVITVNRIDRLVNITGAVERPGSYQLLPEENLNELIANYASGYTAFADPSRLELIRYVNSDRDSGEKLFLDHRNAKDNAALQNQDSIYVPDISELRPVIFVEGAVQVAGMSDLTTSNRLVVRFNQGENYAALVQRNLTWFSAISDTQNAYILRNGDKLPLNLNPMLYDSSYRSVYNIEDNDTLIIPFRQYFVTVAGAVTRPGRYPYIPDRTWDYYIALAGGFEPTRNSFQAVEITDIAGKTQSKNVAIPPEAIVTAKTNGFLYYFNQFAPVLTTVLSIISTTLSILAVTGALN